MELNTVWIAGLAGLVCGILSGFGIGGGSLLMVWMTAAAALDVCLLVNTRANIEVAWV